MQLVDELNMIYTTCLMNYATFSYSKSRQYGFTLALALVSLAIFITLYYHYLQDPAFHQAAYGILTVVMLARSMYVMEFSLRPSLRKNEENFKLHHKKSMTADQKEVSRADDVRNAKILSTMWILIITGLSIFLSGFGFWQIDNIFCSNLRQWRRELGLPWGIILEGHGWWHLLTGIGAYYYLIWGIWLRHCLNGRQDEYSLVWPSILSLPEIVRSDYFHGIVEPNFARKIR
ncbi:alkaline ceramidase ydc1 [Xanthoria calcicola]